MGHCPTEPLRPQFYRRLRLRFFGAKVTSDAGLLAYRELDDALDSTRTAAGQLQDVPVHGQVQATGPTSGASPLTGAADRGPPLFSFPLASWYALRLAGVGAKADDYGQVFRKRPNRR